MPTFLTENQQAALDRLARRDPKARVVALDPWEDGYVAVVTRRSNGKEYVIKPNGFTRRTRRAFMPQALAA